MKQLMYKATVFSAVLMLTACGGSSGYDFSGDGVESEAVEPQRGPVFDPAAGLLPTTNNVFFADSTDGTLNIPNRSNNPIIPQLNTLDGFSTSNPIIANFGVGIDPSSLVIGESVRVFEVLINPDDGGVVVGVTRELTSAELVPAVIGDGKTLAIVPRAPLKESTSYAVVLTKGIADTEGEPSQSSSSYILAKGATPLTGDFAALEPIRKIVSSLEAETSNAAAAPTLETTDIVLSWTFTTQSITPVLNSVATSAKAEAMTVVNSGKTTKDINPALAGLADIYIGTLEVPYYLEQPTATNPTAAVTGSWKGMGGSNLTRFNPDPVNNGNLTIPVMMTVPKTPAATASGHPVVIYQHGITRNRTDVIGLGDAMAQAGFAVVAIDLPLHGAPKTLENGDPNGFHASNTLFMETEPSFDLDLLNNTTGAPGPDGMIDSSGASFINLQSVLTSRDNIRQGVSNLLTLRRSLANVALVDSNKVGFIAHSLGGLVGTTYLGVETMVTPSSLVTTGGSFSTVLQDSASFGPRIQAGLDAAGVVGAEAQAAYFQAGQSIIDSTDPVNFAQAAAAKHPIHMIEIVGDGASNLPDQTVPNSATETLAALMGATSVSATSMDTTVPSARIVRFIKGTHSSILDPSAGLDVTTEIQSQLATYQATNGTTILISDPNVIK